MVESPDEPDDDGPIGSNDLQTSKTLRKNTLSLLLFIQQKLPEISVGPKSGSLQEPSVRLQTFTVIQSKIDFLLTSRFLCCSSPYLSFSMLSAKYSTSIQRIIAPKSISFFLTKPIIKISVREK